MTPSGSQQQDSFRSRFFRWVDRFDFLQIIPMALLITIGLFFIYSTGQQIGGVAATTFWKKQILWVVIGLGIWITLAVTDYRGFKYWSLPIYLLSLASLALVLIVGLKIYGARRWLQVGPLRLQPSEFAKFATLIMLAAIMSIRDFNINKYRNIFLVACVAGAPFLLILLEPDLGSSLVIPPIVAALLFVSNLKMKYIIMGSALGIVLISGEILNEKYQVYPILKGYQRERVMVFLEPDRDPTNRGWNQHQAELAVGSGGFAGKGFMLGTQNALGFLPKTVSNTDFIFSVIAEETGFAGSTAIIALYFFLICSAVRTAAIARDKFGRFIAVGIAAIIFVHTVVNIGMSIRLMPVTGLPLPFISYGGSFMLSSLIYLGVLQSIYAQRRKAFS